ncbi:MAG: hypothetical protein EHM89_00930 [Acidobacteria bacterium]|nr:MAG: hypothetical protein EHM89_00930 [Acidobacteriota bacterium]
MMGTALLIALFNSFLPALASQAQVDGISAMVSADRATVEMGALVKFQVELAFDSSMAKPKTRILNRYSGRCQLTFVDEETGRSFERQPYDTGMLGTQWADDLVLLTNDKRVVLDTLAVHFLSEEGEQLPSGTYSVRALYVNDGGEKMEVKVDPVTGNTRRQPYNGPWEFWSGRVESAPYAIKVLPAAPAVVDVVIPTALAVDTTTIKAIPTPEGWIVPRPMQIAWRCSPDSTQVIRVMKRPGFALGRRWKLESLVGGKTISDFPHGVGSGFLDLGDSFLHPDVSSQLLAATDSELVLHLEIFETSNQPKHLWMPEQGDFKVLWSGQVRYRVRGGGR